MNLGELFIELGVVGDVKPLIKAQNSLKESVKLIDKQITSTQRLLKYRQDLAKATSNSEKQLIKSSFANEVRKQKLLDEQDATQKSIDGYKAMAQNIAGVVKGIGAFVAAGVTAVAVVDRLTNSLLKANQAYVNFNRQTGLSIDKLNEYATAAAMVDYNLAPETVANSIQSLQSNLAQIRLGQGNIAPYQLLGINPVSKDAFGVLDQLRNAIQGISDIDATNLIQQMGLSPEFISILRLSREEFEQLQDELFLNSATRQAISQYASELRKVHLQMELLKDKALVKIFPVFISLMKHIQQIAQMWATLTNNLINFIEASKGAQLSIKALGVVLAGLFIYFQPILAAFTALYLILEDIAFYFMGGKSITGIAIAGIGKLGNKLTEVLKNINFEDNGLIKFFKNLSLITIPLPILAMIKMYELASQFRDGNMPFPGFNTDNIPAPVPIGRTGYNIDNRVINQTNNVGITTNQPVAPTVGNEIITYTNVIDQIPVFT